MSRLSTVSVIPCLSYVENDTDIISTQDAVVHVYAEEDFQEKGNLLAVEALLTVLVNGKHLCSCMRLPGMDIELSAGLCYTQGVVQSRGEIFSVTRSGADIVEIKLKDFKKNIPGSASVINSSGGFLKKEDYNTIRSFRTPPSGDADAVSADCMCMMAEDFFSRQEVFKMTGATQGAALYDCNCNFLAFAEDVGRHNALDKCIGRLFMDDTLENACFCMLTSRLSYGIIEKAVRTQIKVIAGVSAPTSLAVTLARNNDITLLGFFRSSRFNIYTGEGRIKRTPGL
ncbi:MAG TPA: formate dehydrogenase accessory sulfurtransferase FdhD [Spirochaetota bacterium]|nr:formate dehydrogenase accessory sulfurtransferase FdhD [Spirochaetota bacterium]